MIEFTGKNVVNIFSDFMGMSFDAWSMHRIEDAALIMALDNGDVYYGIISNPLVYKDMSANDIIMRTIEVSREFYEAASKGFY